MSDEPEEAEEEFIDVTALTALEYFLEFLASDDVEALSSVVIIGEYVRPGSMRPELAHWSDDVSGWWKHLGMLETIKKELEADQLTGFEFESVLGEEDDD